MALIMHTLAVLWQRLKCCRGKFFAEDTSSSSRQAQFLSLPLIPRAVLATHSEGIAPFDTWADIVAKSVHPSRVCQVFLVAIELTEQVEPGVAA